MEVTTQVLRVPRARLAALAAVALLGTIDVAEFAATEPSVAFKTPGRASGTLFGLGVWVGLALVSGARLRRPDASHVSTATIGLAGLAAFDGVGLAVVHGVAGVGGLRPLVGAALGVAALGLAVANRGRA
jgi:peptidoglycan/LPS O-acetylase OafA/YrhL